MRQGLGFKMGNVKTEIVNILILMELVLVASKVSSMVQEANVNQLKNTQIVKSFFMTNAENVLINFILTRIGNVFLFLLSVDNMIKTAVYVPAVILATFCLSNQKDNV